MNCIGHIFEEASRLQCSSVALPAISCGIFGGNEETTIFTIKKLVEGTIELMRTEKYANIRIFDFVLLKDAKTLTFFKKAVQEYDS